MKTMGLPDDVIDMVKDWLDQRMFYVETNGNTSDVLNSNFGTLQGSVLGPVLFCIFIRPVFDLEELIAYADDNYIGGRHEKLERAIAEVKAKMEKI